MERETRKFIEKVERVFDTGEVCMWEFRKLLTEWGQLINDHCYDSDNSKQNYLRLHQAHLYVKWYGRKHRRKRNEDLTDFVEALIEYINVEIQSFGINFYEQERTTDISGTLPMTMSWTGSKRALIELVYALKSVKCINDGNVKIQHLVEFFEAVFKINLEYFHPELNRMALRTPLKKKGIRAYFLSSLVDGFNAKMQNFE
nr:RteC domain-containing protein [uncultured Carboxylicivirga sp.]